MTLLQAKQLVHFKTATHELKCMPQEHLSVKCDSTKTKCSVLITTKTKQLEENYNKSHHFAKFILSFSFVPFLWKQKFVQIWLVIRQVFVSHMLSTVIISFRAAASFRSKSFLPKVSFSFTHSALQINYRKIPKISPSMYKPLQI